jgi:hypothetical protein
MKALPLIGQDHGNWKGNSFYCWLKWTQSIVRKESHIQSKDPLRRKLGNSKESISKGGFLTACWKQWHIQLSQCLWHILEEVLSKFQTRVKTKDLLLIFFSVIRRYVPSVFVPRLFGRCLKILKCHPSPPLHICLCFFP